MDTQATQETHTFTVKVSSESSSSDTQQVLSSRAVTKCLFSSFLALVSITTALLLVTMRRPLYVVSSRSQDGKRHDDDLNVYSSGVACDQQVQCVSSSTASVLVQHCRPFPLLNNCADGDRLLTLENVRFSMDLTLLCLSLFVLLFIAGRVFTVISHNATLNRIMLGLASAFAALNSILSIALFYVGQCGVSSDHITKLAEVARTTSPRPTTTTINNNDDPIGWSSAAVVFSTPLSSFTAALLLGTVAVSSYNNVDSKITQLSSQAQTRLMVAQLIVTFLVALFCFTFCSPVFFSS